MKKVFVVLLAALFSLNSMQAQEISQKYGDVTNDELSMTVYKGDSSANAVVLNEDVYVFYKYVNNEFEVVTEYRRKLKILNKEGVKYADMEIPYYSPTNLSKSRERIEAVEAFAYNLEDGKVKKERMDKKLIFDERIDDNRKQVKFSIPSVKEGTVIEYKYVNRSAFSHLIEDWVVQRSIPVANAHMRVSIPQYFVFNIETRGSQPIKVEESGETRSFSITNPGLRSDQVVSKCRVLDFSVSDVKAVEDEPYLWCTTDFIVRATFELLGTDFNGYKPYTKSWQAIDKLLADDSDFGDKLNMENPYKSELGAIMGLNLPEISRIHAIVTQVKSKIKWNDKYALFGSGVKAAVKNGVGNNADINFVLLAMLRDAGIHAYPVLLSLRSAGRLPETYASLSKLNTFVIGIQCYEGEKLYLDGSAAYGDVDILPPNLLVYKAREYGALGDNEWVDLNGIGQNRYAVITETTLGADGVISGKCSFTYKGQFAANRKALYFEDGDGTAYKERVQKTTHLTISDMKIAGVDTMSSWMQESFDFTMKASLSGDLIYFPAMLISHITENPFTKKERIFPIEFSYPYQARISCQLTIPDGYQVEETPEPIKMSLDENKSCQCSYLVQQNGNKLAISYLFNLNRTLYGQDEYLLLQKMWETLIAKNTEQIVLKKLSKE